eukprot:CAMPEP_0198212236 /NCGR_PEP_ID=MMETSP1445-20131203/25599_1 /TAXON_ID=36898 /ORGANISM="Pyramimonas sp., Strain CCMP2087" /LENGTH=76 /DNA_ID=CAMNT_0043886637 /DNA_START=1 /DNA_END=228 /DNA_ORIENTATION=+
MEEDEENEGSAADWMTHSLKFDKEKKSAGEYHASVDDYVVVDPLLEKQKGKFNKEEQKRKKKELAWAGKSHDDKAW